MKRVIIIIEKKSSKQKQGQTQWQQGQCQKKRNADKQKKNHTKLYPNGSGSNSFCNPDSGSG